MTRPIALVVAVALSAVGCAASNGSGDGESPGTPAGPEILGVQPDSGRAGEAYPIEVTITGGPFDESGNVVLFGPWTVGTFASSDGRTLVVALPKTIRTSDEVPPMVIQPGSYPIVVETAAGASEPVVFRLTDGGAP